MDTILTLQELKETIVAETKENRFPYEKGLEKAPFLLPDGKRFEAIDMGKDKDMYLVPEEQQEVFLFRGQGLEFSPCYPSLYRGNPTEPEIFIERMRLIQFSRLLESHPAIIEFFKKYHFHVDVEGLAQHYGIKTSVLDLTSNIDVALFFAICPYDSKSDSYSYYNDGKEHNAILYLFRSDCDNGITPSLFPEQLFLKIHPIGLQAFARPGAQRAYGLHLERGESVKCYMYRFTFTSDDSMHYLDLYRQGEKLWVKDELVEKVKKIVGQNLFSFNLFEETYEKFLPKGFSRRQMKRKLQEMHIKFDKHVKDLIFSDDEQKVIVENWNKNIAPLMANNIVRRRWFNDSNKRRDDLKQLPYTPNIVENHLYMTPKMISNIRTLRIFMNLDPPKDAKWVNYTGTPETRKILSKSHLNSNWQEVPSSFCDIKGKPWLTEEECKIQRSKV